MSPIMVPQAKRDVWPRLLGMALAYDLSAITLPSVVVWVYWLDLVGLGVFVGVTLARLVLVYGQLHALVRPLRGWRAADREPTDAALVAIDERIQRGPRSFAVRYSLITILALSLATALGQLGVGGEVSGGRVELILVGLLLVAIAFAISPTLTSVVEPQLLDVRAELGAELGARGLEARRTPTSIEFHGVRLNASYALGVCLSTVALVGALSVDGWREAGRARQQLRVLEAAVRVDAGGPLEPGLAVVDAAELTPILRDVATDPQATTAVRAAVDPRQSRILAAAPLADGRWVVAEDELITRVEVLVLISVIWPLAFLVPLIAANLSSSRAYKRQLDELREATRRMSTGGDLREIHRLRPARNDELGLLLIEFNAMLDLFTELAAAARAVAGGDLSVELSGTGELHEAFRAMFERLQGLVAQLQATAHELTTAAADVQLGVDEHSQIILEQSRTVDEISLTLEQLAASAVDVSTSAAGVLDNANQTRTNADAMVGEITSLTGHAIDIGELLERVREIASRSDLLALNGSLEATRAGEAGRGFALVATEMRRLAERIAQTVVDMQARVGDIGSASASTESATEQTRILAEQTAEAARMITNVTESQSEDTRRAVGSMYDLGVHVDASAAASASTRESAHKLTDMARTLGQLVDEFRAR